MMETEAIFFTICKKPKENMLKHIVNIKMIQKEIYTKGVILFSISHGREVYDNMEDGVGFTQARELDSDMCPSV